MPLKDPFPAKLRTWILGVASRIGSFRISAFLNRRKVAIVFYHGVSARETFPGIENYQGKHVRLSRFKEQLRFLAKRYRVLPLSDVLHAFCNGRPLPPYTVVITFDDGYENNATVALPCLREAGMPATFFLSTSFIGTDRCLWVDQVEQAVNSDEREHVYVHFGLEREILPLTTEEERREADRLIRWFCKQLPDLERESWLSSFFAENGIDPPKASGDYRSMSWTQARELLAGRMAAGSNTLGHPIVTRLTPTDLERQMTGARRACEEALEVPCNIFAYPNGQPGDFTAESRDLLRRLGFSCGLTTVHGLKPPRADPYTLKRIGVSDRTSVFELEAHISGLTALALRAPALDGLTDFNRPPSSPGDARPKKC